VKKWLSGKKHFTPRRKVANRAKKRSSYPLRFFASWRLCERLFMFSQLRDTYSLVAYSLAELGKRLGHVGTPLAPFQGWRQNCGIILTEAIGLGFVIPPLWG
jgi:hypothetical protein